MMNKTEIRKWCELESNPSFGRNSSLANTMLFLLNENDALQKALDEMVELNYNLAHEPSSAFGRVISERDELKKRVVELEKELDAYRKVDQERIDFLKNYFNGKKAYK